MINCQTKNILSTIPEDSWMSDFHSVHKHEIISKGRKQGTRDTLWVLNFITYFILLLEIFHFSKMFLMRD